MVEIDEGDVFTVKFPFYRNIYSYHDNEGIIEEECWTPGTTWIGTPPDDTTCIANGHGYVKYTVVSIFKPGKYPTRVFFTRKFIDPDGKVFGKNKLYITTVSAFRNRIKGYQHEYEMAND